MSEVTKYQAVIKFLTLKGLSSQFIIIRVDGVYGKNVLSYSVVKERPKRFPKRQEYLKNDAMTGRTKTLRLLKTLF